MSDKRQLNPQQVEAVTFGDGPLLIIAGAGTGKTTVITERIKHLILEKNVSPSNILALTFTEKSAAEMEERIDVILPYGYSQMWIETFHAFCDRILRLEALQIGLDPNYKLVTEAESVQFLKKHLFSLNLSYFRPLGNPNKFIQGLLQHFSRLKDEDVTPKEYLDFVKKITSKKAESEEEQLEQQKILELSQSFASYEELKIKESIMDFSDLIANTVKLFRERPNVLAKYQKMFEYILIDEFQDTNFAQNQLAILLAGKKQNITVVGDDDQAIYRWRGAAISNMIQFKKHFPKTKIVTLTKNYRSTQNILDTAYTVIQQNNPDRLEVKENINKKLESLRKTNGEIPDLLLYDHEEQEADGVAKKIEELVKKKKYKYNDFAVLVRANDHALPFIKSFEHFKIPYQFLGPGELFQQEEIKDLIAYLKVLTNYDDSAALYRVLCMDIFAIDPAIIATLLNTAKRRNVSLFSLFSQLDTIAIKQEDKEKVLNVFEIIKNHLALVPKETAGRILFNFIKETGIIKNIMNPTTPLEEQKAINITKFFEKIKSYETMQETSSVFIVLDWIELSMQMGESPQAAAADFSNTNAVNILTIHASKGLEFPVVFMVNLVKDRFPSRERSEQIPLPQEIIKEVLPMGDYHTEEERRLFYVGITRAKDILFMTASKLYGQGKRERKLSPFVLESLGLETVEKIKMQKEKASLQLSLLDLFPESKAETAIPGAQILEKRPVLVSYLSYSQIQTFDVCPLHYKLKYILKIPSSPTPATAFGQSVHAALRDFYFRKKNNIETDFKDIEQIIKNTWISEGYSSIDEERNAYKKAIDVVTKYLTQHFNPENLPLELELPFEFFINRLRVGGRIDRIDTLPDGTIEIIDYKTGTNIPEEKDLKKNLQLTTYALAALNIRELQKKPDQVKLSLYYLEADKKITTTRTMEQLDAAKQEIAEKAKEISESDFLCSKSFLCRNCEYSMLCSAS
ncbi:MAG TPA: ATP-dependent DNA helicase [Patescibacteria group bacterium]